MDVETESLIAITIAATGHILFISISKKTNNKWDSSVQIGNFNDSERHIKTQLTFSCCWVNVKMMSGKSTLQCSWYDDGANVREETCWHQRGSQEVKKKHVNDILRKEEEATDWTPAFFISCICIHCIYTEYGITLTLFSKVDTQKCSI